MLPSLRRRRVKNSSTLLKINDSAKDKKAHALLIWFFKKLVALTYFLPLKYGEMVGTLVVFVSFKKHWKFNYKKIFLNNRIISHHLAMKSINSLLHLFSFNSIRGGGFNLKKKFVSYFSITLISFFFQKNLSYLIHYVIE